MEEESQGRSISDNNDFIRELQYNPFARMEYEQSLRYAGFRPSITMNPFDRIMT